MIFPAGFLLSQSWYVDIGNNPDIGITLDKKWISKNNISLCIKQSFGYRFGKPSIETEHKDYYQFDKNGNIIETILHDSTQRYVYEYNNNGCVVKCSYFTVDGEPQMANTNMVYKYTSDDLLRLVSCVQYNFSGNIEGKLIFKHDSKAKTTTQKVVSGSFLANATYKYDEHGNIIFRYKQYQDELGQNYIFKYKYKDDKVETMITAVLTNNMAGNKPSKELTPVIVNKAAFSYSDDGKSINVLIIDSQDEPESIIRYIFK